MQKRELEGIVNRLVSLIETRVEQEGYGLRPEAYWDVRDRQKSDMEDSENSYASPGDIRIKIDLLERTLELLRLEMRHLENRLPMEKFIQGTLDVRDEVLKFIAPVKEMALGAGTTPIRFQPKLLVFLLFRNSDGRLRVYDLIDGFVRTIWDQLGPLDFKKTRTGVTRCFTNTRFAANTLREYGLLKFTKKEAFKTWVLSLPGILVATKVMEDGDWRIREVEKEKQFDLHPSIRLAFSELTSYEGFVRRLTTVCKPGTGPFEELKEGSRRAYTLLQDYWSILQDVSKSNAERKKESTRILNGMEQDPEIQRFFERFRMYLKSGDMIQLK